MSWNAGGHHKVIPQHDDPEKLPVFTDRKFLHEYLFCMYEVSGTGDNG